MKIFVLVGWLFCLFMAIKNFNTYYQQTKISDAIHRYRINCINTNTIPLVDYCDEEDYIKTLLIRPFDWSAKNILSLDKYDIIKEYIK